MPLLSDSLPVWAIAFRWSGRDPRWPWPVIPLEVEDHLRNLMDAILTANLACETITLEKRNFKPHEREFSVYYWLDDIYACMHGRKFNRRLLRWAHVGRFDFQLWCERMNIPLPEFWFPPGWNLEYQLPEGELRPGHWYYRQQWTKEEWKAYAEERDKDELDADDPEHESGEAEGPVAKLRPSQECRIACQQIARALWREDENRTIASVIAHELIQKYGGASHYNDDTVREWVKVIAPSHVRDRRGRPKKNGDTGE